MHDAIARSVANRFSMTRIRLVWCWKRYMRKGRYRCKRYLLYLPVAMGNQVDLSVDYLVRQFGPAIVLVPKGALN